MQPANGCNTCIIVAVAVTIAVTTYFDGPGAAHYVGSALPMWHSSDPTSPAISAIAGQREKSFEPGPSPDKTLGPSAAQRSPAKALGPSQAQRGPAIGSEPIRAKPRVEAIPTCASRTPTRLVWIDSPVCKDRGPAHCRFSKQILDGPIMDRFGFSLCSKMEDADIIIDRGGMTDAQMQAVLGARKRVVHLHRTDCTFGSMHPWIDHPYLIGVFQEYIPRSIDFYLAPQLQRPCFHEFMICQSHKFLHDPICASALANNVSRLTPPVNPNWAKKRHVNWNWEQYYQWWRTNPSEGHKEGEVLRAKRSFHVFLAVHLRPPIHDIGSLARAAAVMTLLQYQGQKAIFACPTQKFKTQMLPSHVAIPQSVLKCLAPDPYLRYMRQSIVVVCPWGFGERTACDGSAWLAGAVVVKPYSDFVLAFPDMYRAGETYVAVRTDYEDLNSKVKEVVLNVSAYHKMRTQARRHFVRSVNRESMATHFWASVCAAEEQHAHDLGISNSQAAQASAFLPASTPGPVAGRTALPQLSSGAGGRM